MGNVPPLQTRDVDINAFNKALGDHLIARRIAALSHSPSPTPPPACPSSSGSTSAEWLLSVVCWADRTNSPNAGKTPLLRWRYPQFEFVLENPFLFGSDRPDILSLDTSLPSNEVARFAPVARRFLSALRTTKYRNVSEIMSSPSAFTVGLHGTHGHALPGILRDGFDPRMRNGQTHGPGEYFDTSPEGMGACNFSQNSGCVVLTLLLLTESNCVVPKKQPADVGTILVVDNPMPSVAHWSTTTPSYCLPLGLLILRRQSTGLMRTVCGLADQVTREEETEAK